MASSLPFVPRRFARRIDAWSRKREPDSAHATTLRRQRIYILPTYYGLLFFGIFLLILLGSINYENSMGFMLCFLMASISFLSMLLTHQNLNHLHITAANAAPVFAGQQAAYPLVCHSGKGRPFYNILLECGELSLVVNVPPGGETGLQLPVMTQRRGVLPLPRFKVYTEFPLGLFHAWSWVSLDSRCLVYPAPASHPPRITPGGKQSGQLSSRQDGTDDFAGIRDYYHGDPPKHLAWKAVARTGELQTKTFHAELGRERWFRWQDLPPRMHQEQRLSVLCRWILDADRQGVNYGLELPGQQFGVGGGHEHRHQCLRALALYDQP